MTFLEQNLAENRGKKGQHYGIPFPATGQIPFIIAVMDGKHWMQEYNEIPSTDWLTQPND